jgi:fused signal recognition particle receptor
MGSKLRKLMLPVLIAGLAAGLWASPAQANRGEKPPTTTTTEPSYVPPPQYGQNPHPEVPAEPDPYANPVVSPTVVPIELPAVTDPGAGLAGGGDRLDQAPATDDVLAGSDTAPGVQAPSNPGGFVGGILSRDKIDAETWDDLEEALIRADVGVQVTGQILEQLRATVAEDGITSPTDLLEALKQQLKDDLNRADRTLAFEPGAPNVWLFVGVNGVGKTSTVGTVGMRQADEGRTVNMAAGDTFRAAAAEQLETWAQRAGAELIRGAEGGDPSSIIFDAVQRAAARGIDLVLADTAGRLHNKVNLMDELRKVRRVADRDPGKVTEVLLVLDATTGQNGVVQAKEFTDAVDLTGVVLTKLDGSAKGGIALAIQSALGIPIKLVGLGETAEDLIDFDADAFVDALFAQD